MNQSKQEHADTWEKEAEAAAHEYAVRILQTDIPDAIRSEKDAHIAGQKLEKSRKQPEISDTARAAAKRHMSMGKSLDGEHTGDYPPSIESASPAEDWIAMAEESARKYARELGGFPRGTSLIAVNGHTRGWDDCVDLMVRPLWKERDALKAALKKAVGVMDRQMQSDDSCNQPFNEDMADCLKELRPLVEEKP